MSDDPPTLVRANARGREGVFHHPLNEHSEVHGHQLSRATGMKRNAVNWVRIPPGKESYAYHSHHAEEEWVFVLSGRGIAEIEEQEIEVGPGDFMGFPTPSVAHHLKNPFDEDLVYLCGGETLDIEVADFPRHKLRMIRHGEKAEVASFDALTSVR